MQETLIIDDGSGLCKAGLGNGDAPRFMFPPYVGFPKQNSSLREIAIGEEAISNRNQLILRTPIERGIITNWDLMEKIWHYTFNSMKLYPIDYFTLLCQSPSNPKSNREKAIVTMFESFNVAGLYLALPNVLSLYAAGRTSGLVLDCGHGQTHAVPIYEGIDLPHAISSLDLAGGDLDEYLLKLLMEKGDCPSMFLERHVAKTIKELFGCVSNGIYESKEKEYELPDGTMLNIGNERFRLAEPLFSPHLIGMEDCGIHEKIFSSIVKCDLDFRSELYSNVILAGGTSLLQGLTERLNKEISNLAPTFSKIRIIAPPEAKLSAWIGGAIFSSFSTFKTNCIQPHEFDEIGPSIVHRKCF